MKKKNLISRGRALALALPLLLTAGCEPDAIRVYRTPKDFGNKPLRWKTPAGWTEADGDGMRVANFRITGKDGQHAEVAAVPLPGMRDDDLAFVNLWRQQLALPAATGADLARMIERVPVGEATGKLFDILGGASSAASQTNSIVVATVAKGGLTWFIKLQGDAPVVADQRPAFLEFLKSIRIHPNAQQVLMARASGPQKHTPDDGHNHETLPEWKVPEGWQQQAAPQFAVAGFAIPGAEGAGAEVSVSHMGGTAGGALLNVNRWRNQMGLNPVAEGDLSGLAKQFEVEGRAAMLVELNGTYSKTGKPAVMLAAMVPGSGSTWVYKLVGDEQVVAQSKDAFMKFIQTAKHPNG